MWLVLDFTDAKEVAVVPEIWTDKEGTYCVVWPPYKTSSRIMSAVRQEELPTLTWRSYPYKELYRSGMYVLSFSLKGLMLMYYKFYLREVTCTKPSIFGMTPLTLN